MFTVEEAIDAVGTEDAVVLTFLAALNIVDDHSLSINDYLNDTGADASRIDAGELFIWLGY
jgi:GH35 family endo-1,4-beta-xylanase